MHVFQIAASFATLLATCGSVVKSTSSSAVGDSPEELSYGVTEEDIEDFYSKDTSAKYVPLIYRDTGTVTLCCRQFSYIIHSRLYKIAGLIIVYDGLIQDKVSQHSLVVEHRKDATDTMNMLKASMKYYMTSIGLMDAKPCLLQYSDSPVSTAECASGKIIDCDKQCTFTCGNLTSSSTCCDGGRMSPQIPSCPPNNDTSKKPSFTTPFDTTSTSTSMPAATVGIPGTTTGSKVTTTDISAKATTSLTDVQSKCGGTTCSKVTITGNSTSTATSTTYVQSSRKLKFCGFLALGIFLIIPVVYLARRKLKKRKVEFQRIDSTESDELELDQYEDVEPDRHGSYLHRSILPANPTPDQLDQEKTYHMGVRDKGFVYILNNTKFLDQTQERKGSEIDVQNINHIFDQIGYKPVICENLAAKAIRESLEDLRRRIKPSHPSVVLMIMSHGDENGILGVDGSHVTVGEIKDIFTGQRCPALIGKPKIIFVQACRGEKTAKNVLKTELPIESTVTPGLDESIVQSDGYASENSMFESNSNTVESDSAEADIAHYYIAQSTTHGYFSLRSRKNGSFFIQALCEEFLKRAHEESLDTIMNMVTKRVHSEERRFRSGERTVQVPQITKQGIDKDIVLLPKYP